MKLDPCGSRQPCTRALTICDSQGTIGRSWQQQMSASDRHAKRGMTNRSPSESSLAPEDLSVLCCESCSCGVLQAKGDS